MKSVTVACIKTHGFSVLLASIGAGIFSTLAQVLLWLIQGDGVIQSLLRDARFTAAIVMGRGVLPPPVSFDLLIMSVAAIVHALLSFAYCAIMAFAIHRHAVSANIVTGVLFGLVLYAINLYGFTAIFPWFIESRGWVTLVAHLVFGSTAAIIYLKFTPMQRVPGR